LERLISRIEANMSTEWNEREVGQWLVKVGLSQYQELFRENDINGECLMLLDDSSLQELEIKDAKERKRLLMAIQELRLQRKSEDRLDGPKMSGYLEKQGGSNNNKGWRKRFISLENNSIRYFKGENELAGIIFIEDIIKLDLPKVKYTTITGKHKFTFEITTKTGRSYIFCATSLDEMENWMEKISEAVDLRKSDPVQMDVIKSYTPKNERDLAINEGEVIEVLDQQPNEDGYVYARLLSSGEDGQIIMGMVPYNHLKPIEVTRSISAISDSPGKFKGLKGAKEKMKMKRNASFSNLERPDSNEQIMTGWLTKQGDMVKNWKKRWFVLCKDFCLYYYKSHEDKEAIGKILLPSYTIKPTNEINKPFAFKASHPGMRTYFFLADSDLSMQRWINALTLVANGELPDLESARTSARLSDSAVVEVAKARVIKNYIPNAYDREAIELVEGETISIIEKHSGGWWKGVNSKRKVGTFPHTYVEEIAPSSSNRSSDNAPEIEPFPDLSATSDKDKEKDSLQLPKSKTRMVSKAQDIFADLPAPQSSPPISNTLNNLNSSSSSLPTSNSSSSMPESKSPQAESLLNPNSAKDKARYSYVRKSNYLGNPSTAKKNPSEKLKESRPFSKEIIFEPKKARSAIVLYDCESGSPDELNLFKGEVVMILKSEGDDLDIGWWLAEKSDGTQGLLPAEFVKLD